MGLHEADTIKSSSILIYCYKYTAWCQKWLNVINTVELNKADEEMGELTAKGNDVSERGDQILGLTPNK